MKLLSINLLTLMFCSCMTTNFLVDPSITEYEYQRYSTDDSKFNFGSAESRKSNSEIELGAWTLDNSGRKLISYDIKIRNTSENEHITPTDIIILDKNRRSLKILLPNEAVYYLNGMTSGEAIGMSSAMSSYAATQAYSGPVYGTMYSYGHLYGSSLGGYNYSGISTYYQQPNYAAQMASNLALGMALAAASMERQIQVLNINYLKPSSTVQGGINLGKLVSISGDLPIEIHLISCGDEHVIVLDKAQKLKRIKRKTRP